MKYASIVIRLPIDKEFTYRIPKKIQEDIAIGKRVWVPFGKRRVVGYVVGIRDKADIEDVRPIESVIDRESLISKDLLLLTRWISNYYICSWGEATDAVLPGVFKKGKTRVRPKRPLSFCLTPSKFWKDSLFALDGSVALLA